MPGQVIKVVLTNRGAAKSKYGAAGWTKIRSSLTTLSKTDKAHGITTRLLCVDSATDAKKVGATKVTAAADAQALKEFVDRVFAVWKPAYLLLVGGPDLLPQVQLDNPLWTGNPDDDPDRFIPSDLPYACDSPYSTSANQFRGPSRVIGRLPDLMADTAPTVLLSLLATAAHATTTKRPNPAPVFAVSAKVWQTSTQLSVSKLASVSGSMHTSPADGPTWAKAAFAAPIHFINCHGGDSDPKFYGQASATNWNLPTALDSALVGGVAAKATVVSAECCYGAAHWPPSSAGGQRSVAMSYLACGAYGFFGASTVAYGPAAANDYADVLARLFLEQVLAGASLGRAALTARQQFVQGQSFLDPTDIKTLTQFDLLADPSVQPFASAGTTAQGTVTAGVLSRRDVASAIGGALQSSVLVSAAVPRSRAGLTSARLASLLGSAVPPGTQIRTFDSSSGGPGERGLAAALAPVAHIAFLPTRGRRPKSLVVVREEPGSPTQVRLVVRR